jgi:hypothetical protein
MTRHHPYPTEPSPSLLTEAWVGYSRKLRGPNQPANLAQALAHSTHGPVLRAEAERLALAFMEACTTHTVDLEPAVPLGTDGHPLRCHAWPSIAHGHAQPARPAQTQPQAATEWHALQNIKPPTRRT